MADPSIEESVIQPRVAPVRRIVTGHNAQGRAIVVSDEACPHVEAILGQENHATTELWSTSVPADNNRPGDTVILPHRIAPPDGSAVFRVVEFPPYEAFRAALRPDQALMKDSSGSGGDQTMHRTRSVDFVTVISGEIWCVMEEGEVLMHPGDVMVQRGTNHDWQNRTGTPTRVAFVLVDALPLADAG